MKDRATRTDDAVAAFFAALREEGLVDPATPAPSEPLSAEELDEARLRMAEKLIRQMCPGPTECPQRRCRRAKQCRHLVDLRARPVPPDSRRPPGAVALREAILVYSEWVERNGE